MTHRVTARIGQWIDDAIDAQALGDDVLWEGDFTLTPTGPVMPVLFMMPGAVLGTTVQGNVVLESVLAATEADIADVVGRALEGLREARSGQLAGAGVSGPLGG